LRKESNIRCFLPDGSSVLIPFSKWEKMTDDEYHDLNTGNTGRFAKLPAYLLDSDEIDLEDDELLDTLSEEIDSELDLDLDVEDFYEKE